MKKVTISNQVSITTNSGWFSNNGLDGQTECEVEIIFAFEAMVSKQFGVWVADVLRVAQKVEVCIGIPPRNLQSSEIGRYTSNNHSDWVNMSMASVPESILEMIKSRAIECYFDNSILSYEFPVQAKAVIREYEPQAEIAA